jgi:hypothetical protein
MRKTNLERKYTLITHVQGRIQKNKWGGGGTSLCIFLLGGTNILFFFFFIGKFFFFFFFRIGGGPGLPPVPPFPPSLHTYTKCLRGSAICLRPWDVIWFPSLLLRNIEYNSTSMNRSSLISQTQALNPLCTPLNCPSQLPSKEQLYVHFINATKCSHQFGLFGSSQPRTTCHFIEA